MEFHEALAVGMRKLEEARMALGEVEGILAEISSAISEVAGIPLRMILQPEDSQGEGSQELVHALPVQCRLVIVDDSGQLLRVEVGEIALASSVFPCILNYSGQDVRCASSSYLRVALSDLLQSLWFASRLAGLQSGPSQPVSLSFPSVA